MTTKEKILKIIHNEFDLSDAGEQAANSIELLILQEKVELLENLCIDKSKGQEDYIDARADKISELNNQILKLNQ